MIQSHSEWPKSICRAPKSDPDPHGSGLRGEEPHHKKACGLKSQSSSFCGSHPILSYSSLVMFGQHGRSGMAKILFKIPASHRRRNRYYEKTHVIPLHCTSIGFLAWNPMLVAPFVLVVSPCFVGKSQCWIKSNSLMWMLLKSQDLPVFCQTRSFLANPHVSLWIHMVFILNHLKSIGVLCFAGESTCFS